MDALRDTIVDIAGPKRSQGGQAYLDDLQEMRAEGLIDETAFAAKEKAFLDKF